MAHNGSINNKWYQDGWVLSNLNWLLPSSVAGGQVPRHVIEE